MRNSYEADTSAHSRQKLIFFMYDQGSTSTADPAHSPSKSSSRRLRSLSRIGSRKDTNVAGSTYVFVSRRLRLIGPQKTGSRFIFGSDLWWVVFDRWYYAGCVDI